MHPIKFKEKKVPEIKKTQQEKHRVNDHPDHPRNTKVIFAQNNPQFPVNIILIMLDQVVQIV